jgi:hypothetical protein
MHKFSILLLAILMLSSYSASGQNSTNSPYTRYGYGDVTEVCSGSQLAMGGIGAGVRSTQGINSMNPASYSNLDSVTFLFDIGAASQLSIFTDNSQNTQKYLNGNFEYFGMQFPLTKFMGFSMGVMPYSVAGYSFANRDSSKIPNQTAFTDSIIKQTTSSIGSGGISEVYMGTGIKFFDHISVGVNAYYMFGQQSVTNEVNNISLAQSYSSSKTENISYNGFRFRYGVQFYNTFAEKHNVTLGFIYEEKTNLKVNHEVLTNAVISDTVSASGAYQTPRTFGAGFTYTFDNRLTIGFDYSKRQWADALFDGKKDSLLNSSKYAFGLEYLPNPKSRKYFEKMKYRFGFSMNDSYFRVNGITPPQDLSVRFGLGLPFKNSRSILNATLEYGKSGVTTLLREDYFKLSVSVLFDEYWFFKRKL